MVVVCINLGRLLLLRRRGENDTLMHIWSTSRLACTYATAPDKKNGYDSADRVNDPVVGGSGFAEVEHGVKAGTFTAGAALSSVGLPTPITEKYLHLHSEATEQGNSASTLMSVLVTQCYYARAQYGQGRWVFAISLARRSRRRIAPASVGPCP
jgi:hypothetical protein